MNNVCDYLDDYLAGALSGDATAHFSAHLCSCEACREAADQQRWIDSLLMSTERLQLEPTPRVLVEAALKSNVSSWLAGGRYVAAILAAAAVVLVATGAVLLNREAMVGTRSTAEVVTPSDGPHAATKEQEREVGATFVADLNAIAVPVESHRPGVTIVRVYPTFQPRVETQTAALDSADVTNTDDIWSEYSNGG